MNTIQSIESAHHSTNLEIKSLKRQYLQVLKLCPYQKDYDYLIKEPKSKAKQHINIDFSEVYFSIQVRNLKTNRLSSHIMNNLGIYNLKHMILFQFLQAIKYANYDNNLKIRVQAGDWPGITYLHDTAFRFLRKALIFADQSFESLQMSKSISSKAPLIRNLHLQNIQNPGQAKLGFENLIKLAPILQGLSLDIRVYHCSIYEIFSSLQTFLDNKDLKIQYFALNALRTKLISRYKINQLISNSNLLKFAKKLDLQFGETINYVQQRQYHDDNSSDDDSSFEEDLQTKLEKEDQNQFLKPIEFVPFEDLQSNTIEEMSMKIERQQHIFKLKGNQIYLKYENSFSISHFRQFMIGLQSDFFLKQLSSSKDIIIEELYLEFEGCKHILKSELPELCDYLQLKNFSFQKIHLSIQNCTQISTKELLIFLQMVENSKQTLNQFTITASDNYLIDSQLLEKISTSIKEGALSNCKLIEISFEMDDEKEFEDEEIKKILIQAIPLINKRSLKKFEFNLNREIFRVEDNELSTRITSNCYELLYEIMKKLFENQIIDSVSLDFEYKLPGIELKFLKLIDEEKALKLKKFEFFSLKLFENEEKMIQSIIMKHYSTLEWIYINKIRDGTIKYITTDLVCEIYINRIKSRTILDLIFKTFKNTLDNSGDQSIDFIVLNVFEVNVFIDSDIKTLRDILKDHWNQIKNCEALVSQCEITEEGENLINEITKHGDGNFQFR